MCIRLGYRVAYNVGVALGVLTFFGLFISLILLVRSLISSDPSPSRLHGANDLGLTALSGVHIIQCFRLAKHAQSQARNLEHVPPIREQIAKLPARDVVVCFAYLPLAAPDALLRAASDGATASPEELLRSASPEDEKA